MKILLSLILFFLSFGRGFAQVSLIDYNGYTNNVTTFCASPTQPWAKWKDNSLITQAELFYTDIKNKGDGDEKYKTYLTNIHADPSRISIINIASSPTFLKKASYVYKETMGAIYSCAVMNAKVRIINNLLTQIPSTQSNLKKRLSEQSKLLEKNIENKSCRKITDMSELSLKKALLDNTTYQYCNYRQYLYYLNSVSKESLDVYYT